MNLCNVNLVRRSLDQARPGLMLLALTCTTLLGCSPREVGRPSALPLAPRTASVSRDALSPGDLVEVYVLEDESLNGRYEVRAGGHIIIPKIGKIHVAGRTSDEVEALIKRYLQGNQLRTATVMVERPVARNTEGPGRTVFISGNVATPGRRTLGYVANQSPTLYQAILEAGGFSRFADKNRVAVSRRGAGGRSSRTTFDVIKIRDGLIPDVPVEEGDMIFVPEKSFGW